MGDFFVPLALLIIMPCTMNAQDHKFRKLTPEEEHIILHKGTEAPYTGTYDKFFEDGVYRCKQCGASLYRSKDKFNSGCGWPSFDDEIAGAVKRVPDADGRRTEIVCSRCGGHLGHVFEGERFTDKNTRHCVNSISLDFVPEDKTQKDDTTTEAAIFAGGCFWGVEYYMQRIEGVASTEVGYIGGEKDNPTYEEVCRDNTGHAEAIRIIFDPRKVSYETLAKTFFEIHDPTHLNHQGPDMGEQYRSEIFYINPQQKKVAERLIRLLQEKGYKVVTRISPATTFWKAEDYHQKYYDYKGSTPYCHGYVKRF